MKTKKELIKDAWGVIWFLFTKEEKEKLIINNGYYNNYNDNVLEAIDQNEHLFDFIANKGHIPYSLEGIDDNNGWITIESEADLPKQDGMYHVYYNDGVTSTRYYNPKHNDWINEPKATHYQPIVKPKLPLHK